MKYKVISLLSVIPSFIRHPDGDSLHRPSVIRWDSGEFYPPCIIPALCPPVALCEGGQAGIHACPVLSASRTSLSSVCHPCAAPVRSLRRRRVCGGPGDPTPCLSFPRKRESRPCALSAAPASPSERVIRADSFTRRRALALRSPEFVEGRRRGFTLAEVVVSLGIFSILMGIVSGIFLQVLRGMRFVITRITAVDSATLTMEQIARSARMGTNMSTFNPAGVTA